jgi:hypothetical protein
MASTLVEALAYSGTKINRYRLFRRLLIIFYGNVKAIRIVSGEIRKWDIVTRLLDIVHAEEIRDVDKEWIVYQTLQIRQDYFVDGVRRTLQLDIVYSRTKQRVKVKDGSPILVIAMDIVQIEKIKRLVIRNGMWIVMEKEVVLTGTLR